MHFELALIQMRVVGGDKASNLTHACDLINEAAAHGSKLIVLPETMDIGWTHPASAEAAEPIPDGASYCQMSKMATENQVYVCAGLTERSGDKVYNAAVIIGKQGELLCLHRKMNELDIGHPYYAQGDRLGVVATELGTLGLMICADGFAKDLVISRSLCYMGADMIISPCAWAVAADHDNQQYPYGDTWRDAYIPVAREFNVWIAGVSNVGPMESGPWTGKKCIGSSLVIGPDGNEVVQGPYGSDAEKIIYVDIAPVKRPARGSSWHEFWKKRDSSQT